MFALEVGFIAVFTLRIRLHFSLSSYFSFFGGSKIFPQPFRNFSFLSDSSSVGLIGPSVTDSVVCHLDKRVVIPKIEGKAPDRTAKVYKFIDPIFRLDKSSLRQGLEKLSENRTNGYSI